MSFLTVDITLSTAHHLPNPLSLGPRESRLRHRRKARQGCVLDGPVHLLVVRECRFRKEVLLVLWRTMLKIGWKRCPFCCREDIYISHPKETLIKPSFFTGSRDKVEPA